MKNDLKQFCDCLQAFKIARKRAHLLPKEGGRAPAMVQTKSTDKERCDYCGYYVVTAPASVVQGSMTTLTGGQRRYEKKTDRFDYQCLYTWATQEGKGENNYLPADCVATALQSAESLATSGEVVGCAADCTGDEI